jgi:hypothetical protein
MKKKIKEVAEVNSLDPSSSPFFLSSSAMNFLKKIREARKGDDDINYKIEFLEPSDVPSDIVQNGKLLTPLSTNWLGRHFKCRISMKFGEYMFAAIYNAIYGMVDDSSVFYSTCGCRSGDVLPTSMYRAVEYINTIGDFSRGEFFRSELYVLAVYPYPVEFPVGHLIVADKESFSVDFEPVATMNYMSSYKFTVEKHLDSYLSIGGNWGREELVDDKSKQPTEPSPIPETIEGTPVRWSNFQNVTSIHLSDRAYNMQGKKTNWGDYWNERIHFLNVSVDSDFAQLVMIDWKSKFGDDLLNDPFWLLLHEVMLQLEHTPHTDQSKGLHMSEYFTIAIIGGNYFDVTQNLRITIEPELINENETLFSVKFECDANYGGNGVIDPLIFMIQNFTLKIKVTTIEGLASVDMLFSEIDVENLYDGFGESHRIEIPFSPLPNDMKFIFYSKQMYSNSFDIWSEAFQTYVYDTDRQDTNIGYNIMMSFTNPRFKPYVALPDNWLRKRIHPYEQGVPEEVFSLYKASYIDRDSYVSSLLGTTFKAICEDITLAPNNTEFMFVCFLMSPGEQLNVGDDICGRPYLNPYGAVYPQSHEIATLHNAVCLWNIKNDDGLNVYVQCLVALKKQCALELPSAYGVLNVGQEGIVVWKDRGFSLQGVIA